MLCVLLGNVIFFPVEFFFPTDWLGFRNSMWGETKKIIESALLHGNILQKKGLFLIKTDSTIQICKLFQELEKYTHLYANILNPLIKKNVSKS